MNGIRNNKSKSMCKIFCLIISMVLLTGCEQINSETHPTKTHPKLSEAHASVCDISSISVNGKTRKPQGSGVVLKNGYILTASHVIDLNGNGVLDDSEKTLYVDLDESSKWIQVDVVKLNNHARRGEADLALLKPRKLDPRMKGIKVSEVMNILGDSVTLIGRRRDRPASISKGYTGIKYGNKMGSSSASTWFGASGGGVFNEKNELVGIIHAVGAAESSFNMKVPYPENELELKSYTVTITQHVVVPGSSYYVNLASIRKFLKGAGVLPEAETETPKEKSKRWFITWGPDVLLLLLTGLLMYRVRRRR